MILARAEAQARAGQGEKFIGFDDLQLVDNQDSEGRDFVVITSEKFAGGQQITVQGVTSGHCGASSGLQYGVHRCPDPFRGGFDVAVGKMGVAQRHPHIRSSRRARRDADTG